MTLFSPCLPACVASRCLQKVYNAYFHGFTALKDLPPIASMQQNEQFSQLLRRLVDEHGAAWGTASEESSGVASLGWGGVAAACHSRGTT